MRRASDIPCWLAAAFATAVCMSGCGSAHLARRDRRGGTIVLDGDRAKAMDDAHQLMVDHCRGPYQIIAEGKPGPGQPGEWRINYVCGHRAAPDADGSSTALGATGRGSPAPPARPAPKDAGMPDAGSQGTAFHLPTALDLIAPLTGDAGP